MSKDRGKSPASKQRRKQPQASRSQAAEVQSISPLGLIGAVGAALVIAAVLLFVINARINAAKPAPAATAPTATVPAAAATRATTAAAAQATLPSTTLTGGFSMGNAQAKVTFTEFADYK